MIRAALRWLASIPAMMAAEADSLNASVCAHLAAMDALQERN